MDIVQELLRVLHLMGLCFLYKHALEALALRPTSSAQTLAPRHFMSIPLGAPATLPAVVVFPPAKLPAWHPLERNAPISLNQQLSSATPPRAHRTFGQCLLGALAQLLAEVGIVHVPSCASTQVVFKRHTVNVLVKNLVLLSNAMLQNAISVLKIHVLVEEPALPVRVPAVMGTEAFSARFLGRVQAELLIPSSHAALLG